MEKTITRTMNGTYYVFKHEDYPDVTGFNLNADEVLKLLYDGYTLAEQKKGKFKLSVSESMFIAAAEVEEITK